MSDAAILFDLGLVVTGGALLLVATRLLGLPPILAYLLAGLGLGPLTGVLRVSPSLELFSEIGVSLLLFLVGLELSLARVREVGRTALVAGVWQVLVTLAGGALLASAFGFGPREALLLGLVTAFSSTVVVIKLLDRVGGLEETWGRVSIGVLLVQDVLVAIALTLLAGLGTGGAAPDPVGIAGGLARSFGGMALLVGVAAAAVRWGLPVLLGWLARTREALFIASLTWCFGFILAAEAMHVSTELGAFVAGVALAQLPESRVLRRYVHPLVDFFIVVFFVSLGAGLDPGGSGVDWPAALALSLFVLLVKPAIVTFLLLRTGHGGREALLAGLTLGQVSEFGFVLVALAVGAGLASPSLVALVGIVGLLTIGASALLAPRGGRVYELLSVRLGIPFPEPRADGTRPEPPAGHVVVVGMNTLGRRVVEGLAERGESVVAVDTDEEKLAGLPARRVVGDVGLPDVLEEADLSGALLLVSALRIEDVNGLLTHRCREEGVPVSVHAFESGQVEELLEAGADHLMVSKHEAARRLIGELRAAGVVG
ncbi:MAG TPA: cation:proton antiporter [Gemmatimonadota bacterium]|nr:cation:proton antiporter [Gemmatimonadota bacterium]